MTLKSCFCSSHTALGLSLHFDLSFAVCRLSFAVYRLPYAVVGSLVSQFVAILFYSLLLSPIVLPLLLLVAIAIFALAAAFRFVCLRLRLKFARLTLDTTHVRSYTHMQMHIQGQRHNRQRGKVCCGWQPAAPFFHSPDF